MNVNFSWRRAFVRSLFIGAIASFATGAVQAQSGSAGQPGAPPSSSGSTASSPSGSNTSASPGSTSSQSTSSSSSQPSASSTFDSGQTASGQAASGQTAHHNNTGIQFDQQDKKGDGLRVSNVDPGSPAARAGLQANDRVLGADGRTFSNSRHLNAYISGQSGRPVPLLVERNGQRNVIEIFPIQGGDEGAFLGVFLQEDGSDNTGQSNGGNASPANGKATPSDQPSSARHGARITQVFPNGPAAQAGLRPGDSIVQVNGQKVDDSAELVALVHELKPKAKADFVVSRDNQEVKLPVTLGGRNSLAMGGPDSRNNWGGGANPQNGQFRGFRGFDNAPPQMMEDRRLLEQNQRIEEEIRALREEVKQLRTQLQQQPQHR